MIKLQDVLTTNGATLDRKSFKELDLKDGFMVSLIGLEHKVAVMGLDDGILKDMIEDMKAVAHAYSVMLERETYIGLWVDSDYVYFDISIKVNTIGHAYKLGRLNKQLAIFDNKYKKVLTLDNFDI